MEIPWLKTFADAWQRQADAGRLPHAVLLAGRPGIGKRAAAAWMARRKLGAEARLELPQYPPPTFEHPDLRWLRIPEDKLTIGIDQVRNLIDAISLTSHAGGGKVAVIDPANALTHDAANSLLKTLEEPSGDTLLVLIADRLGRLPATLLSRCQRISLAAPDEGQALAWLDALRPGASWLPALRAAGNGPLAAINAADRVDREDAMAKDLAAVATGAASPVEVAAGWAQASISGVLEWLVRQVQAAIVARLGGPRSAMAPPIDDSVLQRMDTRNLFCYLDIINRLRGQAAGSFNAQLTLEALLIDWANGLEQVRRERVPEAVRLALAKEVGQ